MNPCVWSVSAKAYQTDVGSQTFIGLAEEEAERLRGAVEVVSVPLAEATANDEWLPMQTYISVHYNYSPGA